MNAKQTYSVWLMCDDGPRLCFEAFASVAEAKRVLRRELLKRGNFRDVAMILPTELEPSENHPLYIAQVGRDSGRIVSRESAVW